MFTSGGWKIITVYDISDKEVRSPFEQSNRKIVDKYLFHYTCGHETRNEKFIEQYYCEKCKKKVYQE